MEEDLASDGFLLDLAECRLHLPPQLLDGILVLLYLMLVVNACE